MNPFYSAPANPVDFTLARSAPIRAQWAAIQAAFDKVHGTDAYVEADGTADALVITMENGPVAYVNGFSMRVKIADNNTGPATISVNGLGAVPIVNYLGDPLSGSDLIAGTIEPMIYVDGKFMIRDVADAAVVAQALVYKIAAEAAALASTEAKDLSQQFMESALVAQQAAMTAAMASADIYPGARSYVPRGLTGVTITAAGGGGTNGTYTCPLTGDNLSVKASVQVVVTGGAVTSATPIAPGLYVGAAPTPGLVDTSGIPGLAGATLTPVIGYLKQSGQFYLTNHATDPYQAALFQNQSNVAVEVDASVDWLNVSAAIQAVERAKNAVAFQQRANLLLATRMITGDRASVTVDGGTHAAAAGEVGSGGVAATVGDLIPNTGIYEYNGAAWLRVGDTDGQIAFSNGAYQLALTTAQKVLADAARAAAEAARDQAIAARDVVAAAAGLAPTRSAAAPSLMFDVAGGSYADLPVGSNPAAMPAKDWYMAVEFIAPGWSGDGTVQWLLNTAGASGGNSRGVSMPGAQAASNQRNIQHGLQIGGAVFLRNQTFRAGAASVYAGPYARGVAVIASVNGIPHFAVMLDDGTHLASKGDTNFGTNTFMFGGLATITSISRVSNELVLNAPTASSFSAIAVGDAIYVPGIGARIVSAKPTSLQIKAYDVGPDQSGLGTQLNGVTANYKTLTPVGTAGRIFDRAGALATDATLPWRGGLARMLLRHGSTNYPGEMSAALVDGDGYIRQDFLQSIVKGTYKTLPGSNVATLDFGAATIGTGSQFPTATQPTITGTVSKGHPVDQPSWLRVKRGQPAFRSHAQEFQQDFGTVKVTLESDAMPMGATVTVYDRPPSEAGAVVVIAEQPLLAAGVQVDPTNIEVMIHKVPANGGYWARAKLANTGPELAGNSNYYVDFPAYVGCVPSIIHQSQIGVSFTIFTGYQDLAMSAGIATLASTWGAGNVGANNIPGMAGDPVTKANAKPTNPRVAGRAWPDSVKAMMNVFLDGAQAKYGRAGSAMVLPMVRSGHAQVDFVNDGQTFDILVGQATAGVAFSFAALVPFGGQYNLKWTGPGTVEVLANESIVTTDNYAARVGATTTWNNGLAGSWNYDDWTAGTITLPFNATIRVRARARYNTSANNGAVRSHYGEVVTGDEYSYFGRDGVIGSGDMIDRIAQASSVSAIIDYWIYSRVFGIPSSVSDADAKAGFLYDLQGTRARLQKYAQFKNLRTGAEVPYIVAPEFRFANAGDGVAPGNTQSNLQRARYLIEQIAAENSWLRIVPTCLTSELDGANGAHTAGLGSIHRLQQVALAFQSLMGIDSNEHHLIRRVIGGARLGANSIRLFITPNKFGLKQHDPAATAFAGLWRADTETHRSAYYVDTSTWTYAINDATANPYIDLTSPTAIPTARYDLNRGAVVPGNLTLAQQNALLAQTLCVPNGGYDARINRRGDDIHASNTIAGILIT